MVKLEFVSLLSVLHFTPNWACDEVLSQWTNWTECSEGANCAERSLVCWAKGQARSRTLCRHGNTSVQEKIFNCTKCVDGWHVEREESCKPSCYNSTKLVVKTCSSNSMCKLHSLTPCNNLSLCSGQWLEKNRSCNATCFSSGILTASLACEKGNVSSVECTGSCGLLYEKTQLKNCSALTWSSWSSGSCSVSCGGGVYTRSRACSNSEKQIDIVECNAHQCPTWTSWSLNGRCSNGVAAWTRTCVYAGSLHSSCSVSDDNTPFEVQLGSCDNNSTLTTSFDANCDQILYTFTIPLVVGLVLSFIFGTVVVFLLHQRCVVQKRRTPSEQGEEEPSFVASNVDTAFETISSDDKNDHYETIPAIKVVPYRVPLKDPDSTPLKEKRKMRSRSMDDAYFPRTETIVESELEAQSEFVKTTPQVECDVAIVESKTPTNNSDAVTSDFRKLRPSLRRAARLNGCGRTNLKPGNESWQWTQTLYKPTSTHKSRSTQSDASECFGEPSKYRRSQSESNILFHSADDAESRPPAKPLRLNSMRRMKTSSSVTTMPSCWAPPIKPQRNNRMRGASFHASSLHSQLDDRSSNLEISTSEKASCFGGSSISSSMPDLCDSSLTDVFVHKSSAVPSIVIDDDSTSHTPATSGLRNSEEISNTITTIVA